MFDETAFAQFGVAFLAKVLNLSEDDVKEKAATQEGQDELTTKYGEVRKTAKSDGYKEAEGKLQKALNKKAKEVFGVDTDAKDIETAVVAIKEHYQPATDPGTLPELTEKAVKQHSLFIQTEKRATDAEKALETSKNEFEQKLNESINHRVSTLTMQQQAENALSDLKAKLPGHEGQKKLLIDQYRTSFEGIEQKKVGDTVYYFDKDGNRLEDAITGAPLTGDALFRQQAVKFFELDGPDRSSPGAKPNGGAGTNPGATVGLQPRTMAELNKVLESPQIPAADKTAATTFYRANATDQA